ncbi:hypothetical protein, partial [uncultured Clostridium sp.]|uniref:hypothetical protein n=1 Tax=uncultured Clostridium sp. TaxID=59620 RepID=UPI002597704D
GPPNDIYCIIEEPFIGLLQKKFHTVVKPDIRKKNSTKILPSKYPFQNLNNTKFGFILSCQCKKHAIINAAIPLTPSNGRNLSLILSPEI